MYSFSYSNENIIQIIKNYLNENVINIFFINIKLEKLKASYIIYIDTYRNVPTHAIKWWIYFSIIEIWLWQFIKKEKEKKSWRSMPIFIIIFIILCMGRTVIGTNILIRQGIII